MFLFIHLGGLFLAVFAPLMFETYATTLHSAFWFKYFELGLLVVAVTHIWLTLSKVIANSQSGNSSALSSRRKDFFAVFAARTQPIGGILLLSFILIHLEQVRFPRPLSGEEISALSVVLHSPITFLIYLLGSLALLLHLFHGAESANRSLGLLTTENTSLIRAFGRSMSILIAFGFILITFFLRGNILNSQVG
ncbi:Predicted membrane protein [Prochlorococcus marinus subsp. marinus str. CCMP1375]|uniref:Predicted membrane protein n=1 Tax=Prochlorococcus marinus (strain SARG / CCMP1375 / SS120) TaxID=167539 RepID=Q7VCP2_PROMA|nr:Predicted membrane protein [Prochlorococcus marinus subsp. marinus str. CCMP1375]